MYRTKTVSFIITMIVVLLCCALIVSAESSSEEKPTEGAQPTPEKELTEKSKSALKDKLSKDKLPIDAQSALKGKFDFLKSIKGKFHFLKNIGDFVNKYTPSDSKDQREFDFSTNGDDNLQNFYFLARQPLEFEFFEVLLNGKYFLTLDKPELPEHISFSEALWKEYTGMEVISESLAFRLEGSTTHKFRDIVAGGGYIDFERDFSIEIDPHTHLSLFAEGTPGRKWNWFKVGLGFWIEGQQLFSNTQAFRYGLRAHVDIKWKNFEMMIECLPHWNFRKIRFSVSPQIEFKIRDNWSIVFHNEMDFYSENRDLTIEPALDFNPLDIRLTQLIRHKF